MMEKILLFNLILGGISFIIGLISACICMIMKKYIPYIRIEIESYKLRKETNKKISKLLSNSNAIY